ncbi:hypothetical protein V8D89_016064 [Ganoderma adspersum]
MRLSSPAFPARFLEIPSCRLASLFPAPFRCRRLCARSRAIIPDHPSPGSLISSIPARSKTNLSPRVVERRNRPRNRREPEKTTSRSSGHRRRHPARPPIWVSRTFTSRPWDTSVSNDRNDRYMDDSPHPSLKHLATLQTACTDHARLRPASYTSHDALPSLVRVCSSRRRSTPPGTALLRLRSNRHCDAKARSALRTKSQRPGRENVIGRLELQSTGWASANVRH